MILVASCRLLTGVHLCCKSLTKFLVFLQERLQHVLEEIDPVDLSHVMWAMARFDSYPAPGLLDAVISTLPPQIASAEPAVRLHLIQASFIQHNSNSCAYFHLERVKTVVTG